YWVGTPLIAANDVETLVTWNQQELDQSYSVRGVTLPIKSDPPLGRGRAVALRPRHSPVTEMPQRQFLCSDGRRFYALMADRILAFNDPAHVDVIALDVVAKPEAISATAAGPVALVSADNRLFWLIP